MVYCAEGLICLHACYVNDFKFPAEKMREFVLRIRLEALTGSLTDSTILRTKVVNIFSCLVF